MDVVVRKTNLIAEVAKWKKSYDSVPMQHRPDMAISALAECSPKTFQHSAKVQLVVFLAKDPSVAEGLATTPRDCRLSDHSCRACVRTENLFLHVLNQSLVVLVNKEKSRSRHGSRPTTSTAEAPTLIFRGGKPVLNRRRTFNQGKDKITNLLARRNQQQQP